ncbi:bifunctional precorrin-2 dehydrogenase/sirohydrochlorin ferrochelatase [Candidatus Zixiibacteriota bacterium]
MRRFLPIGLTVSGKECLVVGGGDVGTRKVRNLLDAGARVTVVSPVITDELSDLAGSGDVRWLEEVFRADHLDGMFLAVASTDDRTGNEEVVHAARESGVLICDASSSDSTQVIFGALLEDDGITVAVFSDGRDPGQARRMRDRISDLLSGKDS